MKVAAALLVAMLTAGVLGIAGRLRNLVAGIGLAGRNCSLSATLQAYQRVRDRKASGERVGAG